MGYYFILLPHFFLTNLSKCYVVTLRHVKPANAVFSSSLFPLLHASSQMHRIGSCHCDWQGRVYTILPTQKAHKFCSLGLLLQTTQWLIFCCSTPQNTPPPCPFCRRGWLCIQWQWLKSCLVLSRPRSQNSGWHGNAKDWGVQGHVIPTSWCNDTLGLLQE